MVPYPWKTKNRGSLRRRFNEWIVEDARATKRSELSFGRIAPSQKQSTFGGLFQVEHDPLTDRVAALV